MDAGRLGRDEPNHEMASPPKVSEKGAVRAVLRRTRLAKNEIFGRSTGGLSVIRAAPLIASRDPKRNLVRA